MPKVFVHTQSEKGKRDWSNEGRDFLRLPVVGEYFTLSFDGEWHIVDLVVHCPFESEYDAEIYGTKVNHLEILKATT